MRKPLPRRAGDAPFVATLYEAVSFDKVTFNQKKRYTPGFEPSRRQRRVEKAQVKV